MRVPTTDFVLNLNQNAIVVIEIGLKLVSIDKAYIDRVPENLCGWREATIRNHHRVIAIVKSLGGNHFMGTEPIVFGTPIALRAWGGFWVACCAINDVIQWRLTRR